MSKDSDQEARITGLTVQSSVKRQLRSTRANSEKKLEKAKHPEQEECLTEPIEDTSVKRQLRSANSEKKVEEEEKSTTHTHTADTNCLAVPPTSNPDQETEVFQIDEDLANLVTNAMNGLASPMHSEDRKSDLTTNMQEQQPEEWEGTILQQLPTDEETEIIAIKEEEKAPFMLEIIEKIWLDVKALPCIKKIGPQAQKVKTLKQQIHEALTQLAYLSKSLDKHRVRHKARSNRNTQTINRTYRLSQYQTIHQAKTNNKLRFLSRSLEKQSRLLTQLQQAIAPTSKQEANSPSTVQRPVSLESESTQQSAPTENNAPEQQQEDNEDTESNPALLKPSYSKCQTTETEAHNHSEIIPAKQNLPAREHQYSKVIGNTENTPTMQNPPTSEHQNLEDLNHTESTPVKQNPPTNKRQKKPPSKGGTLRLVPMQNSSVAKIDAELKKLTKLKLPAIRHVEPVKMKTAGPAVEMQFNTTEKLAAAKEELEKTSIVKYANIREKAPRQTRILIFDVPPNLDDAHVQQKIEDLLGRRLPEESIWVEKHMDHMQNKTNIIVVIPQYVKNLVLQQKKINFGFGNCDMESYVSIRRCLRCQDFEHHTSACSRRFLYCATCTGNHMTKNCTSKNKQCINCKVSNKKYKEVYDINHAAYDHSCPTYHYYKNERLHHHQTDEYIEDEPQRKPPKHYKENKEAPRTFANNFNNRLNRPRKYKQYTNKDYQA